MPGGTLAICGPTAVDQVGPLVKKSSWSSTLTVSRAREVYQKATVNIDKALVKAQTCQQGRTCQFLQVGARFCVKPHRRHCAFDLHLHHHYRYHQVLRRPDGIVLTRHVRSDISWFTKV